jgi:hypothetical protein
MDLTEQDYKLETLGQELDRWQIIARDLLGYIHPSTIEADPFLIMVHKELAEMPEMHLHPDPNRRDIN